MYPNFAQMERYEDIKLPCEKENRANNTMKAPQTSSPNKGGESRTQDKTGDDPRKEAQRMRNLLLKKAEKQAAEEQPDYYDKRIAAEREAYIRSQQFKGSVFYTPPPEPDSSDEEHELNKAVAAKPNLDFNDILNNMGGSGFLSSGDDEEEKKEALGVKVFRPKVVTSAPNTVAA